MLEIMTINTAVTVLLVTALSACTSATSTEFGKLLGTFGDTTSYDVAGTIYVIDSKRIWLRGFTYNGRGPDAYFYVGSTDRPSGSGIVVPDEQGRLDKLGEYSNNNFILTLPKDITEYKWFSIWCLAAGVSFGDITIPANFVAPAPHELGSLGFSQPVHGVTATEVTILNTRRVKFTQLHYDGFGPAAYFWVNTGNTLTAQGTRVPHGNGKLPGYNGQDIIVTLQEDIYNYGSIGLWCEAARQNFGQVVIPAADTLNIPPYVDADPAGPSVQPLPNCQVLKEDSFHISWMVDEGANKLRLRFEGVVDRDEYMAFGISGSEMRTVMNGSDVIVAYIAETGEAYADDYFLNDYGQCVETEGRGACPDATQGAGSDSTVLDATMSRGVTIINAERPLNASDGKDRAIPLGLTFVSWAMGRINNRRTVAKHETIPAGNVQVDFSKSSSRCPTLTPPITGGTLTPWEIEPLTPKPTPEVITAHIGPAGGEQGYQGIAGQVGWGIAWYLNEQLVPELNVRRNCTYRFEVYGGNNSLGSLADYHPFYITNDKDGGYSQKTPEEKEGEVIYAGPIGGDLCQFESSADPNEYDNFEDYAKTLKMDCPKTTKPGILEWFVKEDTPDVVYYQCYQHRYFGWKINVNGATCATAPLSLMFALLAVAVFNQI